MSKKEIRLTERGDLETVMEIYDHARGQMRRHGNMTQWVNGYPSRDVILKDISEGNSYVVETDGKIEGVFTFIIGEDPTYGIIEGEWPDTAPYGTIHRIASGPGSHGVADAALDFCLGKGVNIRIDTHADNSVMLGWITSRGFTHCGVIYISDGTPREAFHMSGRGN